MSHGVGKPGLGDEWGVRVRGRSYVCIHVEPKQEALDFEGHCR